MYLSNSDGSEINMSYVLDEKVKRAGVAASFAELKKLGLVEKKGPFVPRTKMDALVSVSRA